MASYPLADFSYLADQHALELSRGRFGADLPRRSLSRPPSFQAGFDLLTPCELPCRMLSPHQLLCRDCNLGDCAYGR